MSFEVSTRVLKLKLYLNGFMIKHINPLYSFLNMIQQVWNKKVIAIVEIDQKDIADQHPPLPLFLQIPWNHYLAFYYDQIIAFFSSYTVYPWNKNQFYLTLKSQNITLNGTQIVGHIVNLFKEGIQKPLQLICHFRNRFSLPIIQIKKFFKYSLKASTSIRNQKFGASILTLQMSIDNVDKLFESFKKNNLNSYLGSKDFESGNLGFSFIISKTQRVPVKIIAKDFIIERGVQKDHSLSEFLAFVFQEAKFDQNQKSSIQQEIKNETQSQQKNNELITNQQSVSGTQNSGQLKQTEKQECMKKGIKYNYLFQKYTFYMHGVRLTRGQYPMTFFQRFCHPDGFLYIFFEESN